MKISPEHLRALDPKTLFRLSSFTRDRVLGVSWWAMLLTGLALLAVDGLLFYRYGLGHAPLVGEAGNRSGAIRLEEEALRGAAAALNAHRAEFAATSSLPADFPNPFR